MQSYNIAGIGYVYDFLLLGKKSIRTRELQVFFLANMKIGFVALKRSRNDFDESEAVAMFRILSIWVMVRFQ